MGPFHILRAHSQWSQVQYLFMQWSYAVSTLVVINVLLSKLTLTDIRSKATVQQEAFSV